VKQHLSLKLPIDKDEATRVPLFQLCKSGWSLVRPMCFYFTASNIERKGAACDDSNQAWQDSVVPGMCTMLWSEKCSHTCYGPSSGSIIGLSSFMATAMATK